MHFVFILCKRFMWFSMCKPQSLICQKFKISLFILWFSDTLPINLNMYHFEILIIIKSFLIPALFQRNLQLSGFHTFNNFRSDKSSCIYSSQKELNPIIFSKMHGEQNTFCNTYSCFKISSIMKITSFLM